MQKFDTVSVPRTLIVVSALIAIWYFTWWLDISHIKALPLYLLLLGGEIYHVWQALGYLHTVWDQKLSAQDAVPLRTLPAVDVFITVAGEPREVVERTVAAAAQLQYPRYQVYVLNDGYVADKHNWREAEEIACRHGCEVITRIVPGGAKAGNINNALQHTRAPLVAILDADHVPRRDFLRRIVPHLAADPALAFVQTPQYYQNRRANALARAAWEQQEFFFGPICQGKNRLNATFWCGTNAVLRRRALESIGGVPQESIAEDFLASLLLHKRGWRSLYVPAVLADGLAPTDLKSYFNQQYRWARGSLEVLFRYNPLWQRGLTWAQRFQYLYSAGYYLGGCIVLINAVIPLVVLVTGNSPVSDSAGSFMVYFFPFLLSTLYVLMRSTNYSVTFRAVQLTMSSFFVFVLATIATMCNRKSPFKITSKQEETGNYLAYALPNVFYALAAAAAITYALAIHGFTPAVVTNSAWALFNTVFFLAFIQAAYPWRSLLPSRRVAGNSRAQPAPAWVRLVRPLRVAVWPADLPAKRTNPSKQWKRTKQKETVGA